MRALNFFEVKCQISHDFVNARVKIEAMMHAKLIQLCVLTLQEIEETVKEPVHLDLVSKCGALDGVKAVFYDGPEEIELETDGLIDMGEIFVQYLCLSINPYPRVGQSVSE